MWVYLRVEDGTYSVGFYAPHGQFVTASKHDREYDAIERVHYLNGGADWGTGTGRE